ncbi:MAG TPA: LemA family protein [Candidatus Thermoplasmatota archaeon]|nr:LemA family protein [Candidatus Thermoplasmatota archaeon]
MVAGTLAAVVGLVVLALLVYVVVLYNSLVRVRNNVDRAWANVDVILQQRSDEVPNLVNTVKGYAAHEKTVLEEVTRARAHLTDARGSPAALAAASAELSAAFTHVFAVAEAYPQLKASDNFLALQKRISSLEDILADRREFYNDSVAIHNTRIQEFPDLLLANQMRLTPREYFKAEGAARAVPSVKP